MALQQSLELATRNVTSEGDTQSLADPASPKLGRLGSHGSIGERRRTVAVVHETWMSLRRCQLDGDDRSSAGYRIDKASKRTPSKTTQIAITVPDTNGTVVMGRVRRLSIDTKADF